MKKLFIIISASVLITACDKQIDKIRPLTKIDKEGELSSVAGIEEATVGNYTFLHSNSASSRDYFQMSYHNLAETRGDNVTLAFFSPQINKDEDAFYFRNNNGQTLGHSYDFYFGSYQGIVSINTVLEGIKKMEEEMFPAFSQTDRDRVTYAKGENMFLRAFNYFNLLQIYGKPFYQDGGNGSGVPLKLTSNMAENPAPSTVKEVYDFIIPELKAAAQLMKVPVSKSNSFASPGAVWALLSRIYLYMGGSVSSPNAEYNALSLTYADSVINYSGIYELLQGDDYKNMFADDALGNLGRSEFKNNKEIVFAYDNAAGFSPVTVIYNSDLGFGGTFVPSSEFKQLLLPGDIRSTFFRINPTTGREETTKHLVAFVQLLGHAPLIYFRTGEIYLNRAEAYAKTGDFSNARFDLKAIHTRAGLPASDIDAIADQDLLTAILKERRIELAFEGHASFDYFRNGLPMTRLAADNNGNPLTIQPDDPKVVFDIPAN